jgi:hypothetical protein
MSCSQMPMRRRYRRTGSSSVARMISSSISTITLPPQPAALLVPWWRKPPTVLPQAWPADRGRRPAARHEPELFGSVASDPVISRLVTALARDAPRALRAIRRARAPRTLRADRLDPDARPARHPRPALGTPPPAIPPLRRGRADRPRRPPGPAPPVRPLTVVPAHHHRAQTARRPRPRLTPATPPGQMKGHPPGTVEPRPPGTTSGHQRCPRRKRTPLPAARATDPRSRNVEAS